MAKGIEKSFIVSQYDVSFARYKRLKFNFQRALFKCQMGGAYALFKCQARGDRAPCAKLLHFNRLYLKNG